MIGCLGMMGFRGYHCAGLFFLSSSILARLSFSSWAARAFALSSPFSNGAKGMRLACQALNYFSCAGDSSFAADSAVAGLAGAAGAAGSAGSAGSASGADSLLAGLVFPAELSGYSSSPLAAGFLASSALGAGSSYLDEALDGAAFWGASSSASSPLAGFFCSWMRRLRVSASSTNKTKICKFFISFLILYTLEQSTAYILQIEVEPVISVMVNQACHS